MERFLKKMLKEKQLTYASDTPKKLVKNWKFLQDNSTVHRSSKSMEEEIVGERLAEHPPLPPDLNPCKDLWSYLDRKVKAARVASIYHLKRVSLKSGKTYLGLKFESQ